jgi:CHRD domain
MPVGLLVAALVPQAGSAQRPAPSGDVIAGSRGDRVGLAARLAQPLFAVAAAGRHTASFLGHSSHSSHVSHASHSSHVSSSPSPPAPSPPPAPAPTPSQSATHFVAALTVGQEVPRPNGHGVGASGRLTGTLNGRVLSWQLTFAHLSTPVVAVDMHLGGVGTTGARVATLCRHCASPRIGVTVLSEAQVARMRAGGMYVEIRTQDHPHGEVRGQIRRQAATTLVGPSSGGGGGHVSHSSHASHASHSSHVSSS